DQIPSRRGYDRAVQRRRQSVRGTRLAAVWLWILMAGAAHATDDDTRPLGRPMEVGLFGKLPSHGDFLRRRASDAFVDAWDAWLREGLAASREALGERWLDVYLTS